MQPVSVGAGVLEARHDREKPSHLTPAPTTMTESNLNNFNEPLFLDFLNDPELQDIWDVDQDIITSLPNSTGVGPAFLSPILTPLEDEILILSNHYFSSVCQINSCFDSHRNPFRSFVGDLMASSPFVYHIVMTVSASHICHREREMAPLARRYRHSATLYLTEGKASPGDGKLETLLGSVLLGMTSAWQDPASLGLAHLRSARVLFKEWFNEPGNSSPPRSISFMVGIMAYWEAMTSFLTTDGPETFEYLTTFSDLEHRNDVIYPNPWTGISTTLFIYAAHACSLCRQNRVLRSLSASMPSSAALDEIYSKQFREAIELKRKTLQYSPPYPERIEDPSDGLTSIHHLECLAQIYRLTVLLQLHITFPGPLRSNGQDDSPHQASSPEQLGQEPPGEETIALAVSILNLLSSLPESSGIRVLSALPLVIAGSSLQNTRRTVRRQENASNIIHSMIVNEVLSLHCSDLMLPYWRSFVRQKLQSLHEHVGIDTVLRAIQLLDAVWLRTDLSASASSDKFEVPFIHWMDAMAEECLESIFG